MSGPKILVCGLGSIGSRHVNNLLDMDQTNLLGYDINPDPHEDRLPVVGAWEDVEDWKPEKALVCTPPALHFEQASKLLAMGADVFVEKPMTATLAEAVNLTALARHYGKVLAVGYMLRGHARLRSIARMLHEQEFGRVLSAELTCHWQAREATYPWPGVVPETSHELDAAVWLFGPVEKVLHSGSVEHEAILHLQHLGGTKSWLRLVSNAAKYERRLVLFTDLGEIRVTYEQDREMDKAYQAELGAFLAWAPLCTGLDGQNVMELMERLK